MTDAVLAASREAITKGSNSREEQTTRSTGRTTAMTRRP
jgi:hypothetical protein